ncbi:hypothetical protein C8R47DRAFT_1215664 [Mycena vitilis]|nr:hypothetical protein C8R47DRAFT_1215664 [Mycena vitilis]
MVDEYRMSIRARNSLVVSSGEIKSDAGSDSESATEPEEESEQDDSDSESSASHQAIFDTDSEGSDYTPDIEQPSVRRTPAILRPRVTPAPSVNLDLTPFPDSFTRAHLASLGFEFIRWNEQPGASVDLKDRVVAMYVGRPSQALPWERAVIEASHDMLTAREAINHCLGATVENLPSGIRCGGRAGRRPQDMWAQRPVSTEHMVISMLRNSRAMQTITSFQNAVYRNIAPHLSNSSHEKLALLKDYDPTLPFCRVDYQFVTDSFIRKEDTSYTPGLTAFTLLGDYRNQEGEIILWTKKKVVNFPVGSTFLMPKWMPYSFTTVEAPGHQMILKQSCDNAVWEYVRNNCSSDFTVVDEPAGRDSQAEEAARLYKKLADYDDEYEVDLYLHGYRDRYPSQMNVLRGGGNNVPAPCPPLSSLNSRENPLLVDENGEIVHSPRRLRSRMQPQGSTSRRSTSGRFPHGGPPSLIRQDIPQISPLELELRRMGSPQLARLVRARSSPYPSHWHPITGTYIGLSATAMQERRPLSSAATTVRRPNGWRLRRATPLTQNALYLTDERPPLQDRQVSPLPCGHTFCYVCIRIYFETTWNCPACDAIVTRAPKPDSDSETVIALAYGTEWNDTSVVIGTWDGLSFPKLPRRPRYTPTPSP